jgi:hypothetical protein
LDDIKNFQIQIVSDDEIYLNKGKTSVTSWEWSRVAELRSFYVYRMLKLKDDSVHYYSTSEVRDVCLYFDIKHNNKDLALDVKYDTKEENFTSKLFYRDGSDLPEDLKNKKLEEIMLCGENNNIETSVNSIIEFKSNINKESCQ